MTALISMDRLDVHQGLNGLILKQNTVAAHDISCQGCNFSAISGAGRFGHGDFAERNLASVVETGDLDAEQDRLLHELNTFD